MRELIAGQTRRRELVEPGVKVSLRRAATSDGLLTRFGLGPRASLVLAQRARASALRSQPFRRAAPRTPRAQPSSASSSPSPSPNSRSIRARADAMSLTLKSRATTSARSISGSGIATSLRARTGLRNPPMESCPRPPRFLCRQGDGGGRQDARARDAGATRVASSRGRGSRGGATRRAPRRGSDSPSRSRSRTGSRCRGAGRASRACRHSRHAIGWPSRFANRRLALPEI
jgi:hypothetical protein